MGCWCSASICGRRRTVATPADPRFAVAIAAIDAANAADPNMIVVDGVAEPKEVVHARRATAWVLELEPEADDVSLLAARAHHLRRWALSRSTYDEGRAGYLRWRAELKKRHAIEAGAILRDAGYDDDVIERVQRIIRKEGLGRDPQVQTHEDALCLVFLESQFGAVADKLGDEKTVDVVRKTLKKMSPAAISLAVAMDLTPHERSVLEQAAGAG